MFIDRFFKRGRHNPDDTRFKSLLKTISWRVLASTDTLMIAWLLTGNIKTAGQSCRLKFSPKCFSTMCMNGFGHDFYECETGML